MKYYAGIYMRVSKEDKIKQTSESIANQKKILEDYCNKNQIYIAEEYIDDGCSGTNFDRPAFQRMITDAQKGIINMIVVKDASRLGRNSGQMDYYTNVMFSKLKLRYIAISDGIDKDYKEADTDIKASFVNLMNEWYAGDISRKIRSALQIKMKNGEYIGSFAPFGYRKHDDNKNKLCIDEVAAQIVQLIFSLAAKGLSAQNIADELNRMHCLTPSSYRASVHDKKINFRTSDHWNKSSVLKILNNETYLGHCVQGKTMKVSYKSDYIYVKPQKEQIKIESTHEPIVTKKLWEQAHRKMKSHKIPSNSQFQNIFSQIAFCADCKKPMSSAKRSGKVGLICGTYKSKGKTFCTGHYISYQSLCDVILNVIKIEYDMKETQLSKDILTEFIDKIYIQESNRGEQFIELYLIKPHLDTMITYNINEKKYTCSIKNL